TPGELPSTFAAFTHASLSSKPSPAMSTSSPPTWASSPTSRFSTLAAASVAPPARLVTSLVHTSRASTTMTTRSTVPAATPSPRDCRTGASSSRATLCTCP
ncbi:hypothetical protein BGZ52_012251, partial [Haplosporangium bisporale]